MKKILFALLLTMSISPVLFAQMSRPAAGFLLAERYDSSVVIRQADYIVQGEVVFLKTSSVTIEAGTRLFFEPGASLRVNGNLYIKGEANKLVEFSSAGGRESGTGMIIAGNNPNAEIKMEYASFKYLLKPLHFEKNWYRKGVEIANSEFFNTYEFNDAVAINEVEFYLNKEPLEFNFHDNVFGDNYANLSVYNATSYRVKFKFDRNVLANNFYFDSRAKEESNPLYLGLDDIQGKFVLEMKNNAFADNYIFTQDSLRLYKYGSLGYVQTKKEFQGTDNFSKNPSERKFSQAAPVNGLHAFTTEVTANGKPLDPYWPLDSIVDVPIQIVLNTGIPSAQPFYKVYYNFIDTATGDIIKLPIKTGFDFTTPGGALLTFRFDKALLTEPFGYISLENLRNADNITVPNINLGILDFFKQSGFVTYRSQYVTLTPVDINRYNPVPPKEATYEFVEDSTRFGKWEVGLFGGVGGYSGDLNQRWFNQEKYRTAFSARVRRYLGRNISAVAHVGFTKVSGRDYGLYGPRRLSFESNIINFQVMAEYHFSDLFRDGDDDNATSLGKKFYPSLGAGVGLIHFNPKGRYIDGTLYNLRQFGTEGQTAPGGKKYSTIALTLPSMIALNYRINNKLKVAVEFVGIKTFTDYIDDASKVRYVADNIIRDANPNNPDVASYFRNPGRTMGARGNPKDMDFIYHIGISVWYRFHPRAKSNANR